MFWFKKKEIIIDCFVTHSTIHDIHPVAPAYNFFPEGWKRLDRSKKCKPYEEEHPDSKIEIEVSTSKKCVSIINLFTSGFIIPAWSDFDIEMSENSKIMSYSYNTDIKVRQHPSWQLWDELYSGYGHAKVMSPWIIREKEGVHFSWHQCDWNNTTDLHNYRIVSGVLDFKYQHQSNINMFIKQGNVISFKAGEPLVHLIPLSDREVKIKTHLVTKDEIDKIDYRPIKYMNSYNNIKKVLSKKGKCPFNFT
jgi:hypothetical protein